MLAPFCQNGEHFMNFLLNFDEFPLVHKLFTTYLLTFAADRGIINLSGATMVTLRRFSAKSSHFCEFFVNFLLRKFFPFFPEIGSKPPLTGTSTIWQCLLVVLTSPDPLARSHICDPPLFVLICP